MCYTGDLLPPPAQEEEGTWLPGLVSEMIPVHGCGERQCLVCGHLCVWPCLCPLCLWPCVSLWPVCSALLLVKPANGKAAAISFGLGKDSGPQAPGQTPAAVQGRSWARLAAGGGPALNIC